MQYCLEVNNLSKQYSSFALKNISFSLPSGCIMGLIGENGAGKTTTLKAILNLIHTDSGQIRIFGADSIKDEKKIKEDIGIVLDECNFPDGLKAKDVSVMMKHIYQNWDTPLFYEYLKKFDLPDNKKIKEFSRGMKMKLSICAALSHHPKLLILDEATSGLDPIVRNEILDVFLEFIQQEDHSILVSSHITSDLEKIADYITFLHNGEIAFSTSTNSLLYDYAILKCKHSDLSAVEPSDILAYHKGELSCDILIKDRQAAVKKYPDFVIDNTTLEEIMLLLVKGEKIV